jgi:hypothetical protein
MKGKNMSAVLDKASSKESLFKSCPLHCTSQVQFDEQ